MLLSNDLDNLPTFDLYERLRGTEDTVPVDEYIRNVRDSLNTDQREVISMLSKQHGPASFVQGPPGTGIAAALLLIKYDSVHPEHENARVRDQVIMAAPTNILASELAGRINDAVTENVPDRDIMVLRSYVVDTEVDICQTSSRLDQTSTRSTC